MAIHYGALVCRGARPGAVRMISMLPGAQAIAPTEQFRDHVAGRLFGRTGLDWIRRARFPWIS